MQSIREQFALSKLILDIHSRLAFRICTQKLRVLPDFFGLGPPRSGTSLLYRYLDQHPGYVRPFMKELGYSADPERIKAPHGQFNQALYRHLPAMLQTPLMRTAQGLFYQNGAAGYRKLFPLAANMKKTAQQHGRAITGEFTVLGLYDPALARGFPYCLAGGDTRFITILRDPVDFLFSFFTVETSAHFRRVNRDVSFERFVQRPEELYPDDPFMRNMDRKMEQWRPRFEQYSFFDESRYSLASFLISYIVFVKHWARSLPQDRFLVLSFNDLCERPQETMHCVFEFLQLPALDVMDMKPVNANTYTEAISQQAASCIREVSRPYTEALYEFLGRDLGWA